MSVSHVKKYSTRLTFGIDTDAAGELLARFAAAFFGLAAFLGDAVRGDFGGEGFGSLDLEGEAAFLGDAGFLGDATFLGDVTFLGEAAFLGEAVFFGLRRIKMSEKKKKYSK